MIRRRIASSIAIASAIASTRESAPEGPTSCTPTGRPAAVRPAGRQVAGRPSVEASADQRTRPAAPTAPIAPIAAPTTAVTGPASAFDTRWEATREAWAAHGVAQNSRAVDAELEALARDASFDLAETITRWDTLMLTKGIGTQLQGREEQAAGIHRRLIAAHQSLHAATTPRHRIEAVLHADTLRATAQSFL